MLTVLVAVLAVVLSPHNVRPAHADTGSTSSEIAVHVENDLALLLRRAEEYADGTDTSVVYDLQPYRSQTEQDLTNQEFAIAPNDDGTFRLINRTSRKCVVVSTGVHAGDLSDSDCSDADAQKWYLQPVRDTVYEGHAYLIRHVGDDKCMEPTVGVTESAMVGVRDCTPNNVAQSWSLGTENDGQLRTMAIKYALKQFDAKSSVIPRADYKADDSETATLGDFQNVTAGGGRIVNGTSEIMDKQVNWSQTTSYTYTAGGAVTTTAGITFGSKDGPVQGKFEVAIQGNWSNSWRTGNTQGGSATIHIRPNQYGWFLRAQLTKKVTGTWTFTSDVGYSWTGLGTATVPAKDGTDSKNSDLIGCSSDSELPVCKDHDPGRA
ncbi:RICIN domain-containing protein [Streptomyces sioyaensis]|uniref:RICIN domain-containing protein n=1 Tax=Streptomyces sioyaensis TaxID=67364 RepID=UPI00378F631E